MIQTLMFFKFPEEKVGYNRFVLLFNSVCLC